MSVSAFLKQKSPRRRIPDEPTSSYINPITGLASVLREDTKPERELVDDERLVPDKGAGRVKTRRRENKERKEAGEENKERNTRPRKMTGVGETDLEEQHA